MYGFTLRNAPQPVRNAAYLIFLVAAIGAAVANWSGEGAEELVDELSGVAHDNIEEHEDAATFALWTSLITGGLALAGLVFRRSGPPGTVGLQWLWAWWPCSRRRLSSARVTWVGKYGIRRLIILRRWSLEGIDQDGREEMRRPGFGHYSGYCLFRSMIATISMKSGAVTAQGKPIITEDWWKRSGNLSAAALEGDGANDAPALGEIVTLAEVSLIPLLVLEVLKGVGSKP